jgi:hypothetical protein
VVKNKIMITYSSNFKITSNKKLQDDLRSVMLKKINVAYKKTAISFSEYMKAEVGENLIYNTDLVKWLLSEEGMGFLGWRLGRVTDEINRMKEIVNKTIGYKITDTRLELFAAPYTKMADELVVKVIRMSSSNDNEFTKVGKLYQFPEFWFEWIVEGYTGNPSFVVAYAVGKGESGIAHMRHVKSKINDAAILKRNTIKKIENPYVQAINDNKGKLTKYIISTFKKNLRMA